MTTPLRHEPGSGRRALRSTAVWLAALALAGCGGGFFIGIDAGRDSDDDPPSVSLAVPANTVQAGAQLTIAAAATDDNGIDDVVFYRLDDGNFTVLGTDEAAPYNLAITVPDDGRTTLTLMARARDLDGNTTDSQLVSVVVTN